LDWRFISSSFFHGEKEHGKRWEWEVGKTKATSPCWLTLFHLFKSLSRNKSLAGFSQHIYIILK
jgi:hypothetical protein